MATLSKAPSGPFSRWVRRPWWVAAGVAALFGVAAVLSWGEGAQPGVVLVRPGPAAKPDLAGFAISQQGTTVDGRLTAPSAADQSVLPYAELRRTFDYFLSTIGEQDLSVITRQIHAHLDAKLPAAQAVRAKRLLDSYMAFRRALVGLEVMPNTSGDGVAAIAARMQGQLALRLQHFTREENEAMFGFEDAYDRDALARFQVAQNSKLGAEEKRVRYAELDAAMPPQLRADRDASGVVSKVEAQAADMRLKGASLDEIYRMRAQAFDAGAATRLAALDVEEAAWSQRVAAYHQARALLLKQLANATASERAAALDELQRSAFTEQERLRLAAFEPAG